MQKYVLGFFYQHDNFLMVRKEKGPEINIGKWNGIGGGLLEGEYAKIGMSREFNEEVDFHVPPSSWGYVGSITSPRFTVSLFKFEFEHKSIHLQQFPHCNDVGEELCVIKYQPDFPDYAENMHTILPHITHGVGELHITQK